MSLFKETLRDYTRKQIFIREKVISRGNPDIGSRRAGVDYTNEKNSNALKLAPGAFFSYNSKQCIIRMSSLVDLMQDIGLDIGGSKFENYKGETFARNYILQGGVLSDYERRFDQEDGSSKRVLRKVNEVRGGFPRSTKKVNLSYGDPSLVSDPTSDGYGVVPMPGIVDLNVRTTSAYGSLRQAKINFVCHNLRQLEILELLYMRPGYPVTVEWGWSPYIANNGDIINEFPSISDNEWFWDDKIANENTINNYIISKKEHTAGNYDGFLGYVTNFNYTARADGGFDCTSELISMGECLDSLKAPSWSYSNSIRTNGGDDADDFIYSNSLGAIIKSIKELTTQVDFPWYKDAAIWIANRNSSGLLDFTDAQEEQTIKRNAAFDRLAGLLGYETARASIIAKDSAIENEEGDESILSQNDAYIRLDALVELINEEVIPKTAKGDPTVMLSLNYFIPQSDGTYVVEPIRYAKYDGLSDQYLDVSCNSRACVLPHQWKEFRDTNVNIGILKRIGLGLTGLSLLNPMPHVASGGTTKERFEKILRFRKAAWTGEQEDLQTEEEKANGKSLTITSNYASRRIGNIFLGVDFVNDIYKSVFKDDKASIGDFLNTLLAAISDECPSHKFGLITDQENTNIVYIIDLPMTTKDMSDMEIYYEDIFKFNVLSNYSIIRDFKYSTQIPSALKATIAINAQSGAGAEDIDSLTFAAFNSSIKSRIASATEKFSEEEEKTYFNENNARQQREKRLKTLKSQIKEYHDGFFNTFEENDQNQEFTSIVANIKSIIKEAQSIENYKFQRSDNFINNQAIIPIDLNLKMDGISGIVMGNVFRVDETRLPKAYKNNSSFICVGEEQQITSGQDWTTNIRAQLVMIPNAPVAAGISPQPQTRGVVTDVTAERQVTAPGDLARLDERFSEDIADRFEKINDDLIHYCYLRGNLQEEAFLRDSNGEFYIDINSSLYNNNFQNIYSEIQYLITIAFEELKAEIFASGLDIGDYQQEYLIRRDERSAEIYSTLMEGLTGDYRGSTPITVSYGIYGNLISYQMTNLSADIVKYRSSTDGTSSGQVLNSNYNEDAAKRYAAGQQFIFGGKSQRTIEMLDQNFNVDDERTNRNTNQGGGTGTVYRDIILDADINDLLNFNTLNITEQTSRNYEDVIELGRGIEGGKVTR
jgi:hypothetical protein